jgi:hypothetical protein
MLKPVPAKLRSCKYTLSLLNSGWCSVSVKSIISCSELLCHAYAGCMLAMSLVALFSDLWCSIVVHFGINCVERRNMMVLLFKFPIIRWRRKLYDKFTAEHKKQMVYFIFYKTHKNLLLLLKPLRSMFCKLYSCSHNVSESWHSFCTEKM